MACPSKNDLMIRNLVAQRRKKDDTPKGCNKQFPDCPNEPNKEDCKRCPFWKK